MTIEIEAVYENGVLKPSTPLPLKVTHRLSQQVGLLTNDALTAAVMQASGLSKIASGDTDFDRVPGISSFREIFFLTF